MSTTKACVAICLAATFCTTQAAVVNIRGTVRNGSGVGLAGATVLLERARISATTGADGSFALGGATATWAGKRGLSVGSGPVRWQNGRLELSVSGNTPVSVAVLDVGGRRIFSSTNTYGCGTHSLSVSSQGTGVSLLRITIGKEAHMLRVSPPGECTRPAAGSGAPLARHATAWAGFADVIAASKDGQIDYRRPITTPDTSGIVITMVPNAGNVTDADGNVYQSVRLGDQVWTVQNLRTTKYNDNSAIPHVTDKTAWSQTTSGAYCYYENSPAQTAEGPKYGALYNWYAVNTRKLAPAGWHVATHADWETLVNYLMVNGYNWDGTKATNKVAKAAASKTEWAECGVWCGAVAGTPGFDPAANNSSGFTALPGGSRDIDGTFSVRNYYGRYWSATEYEPLLARTRFISAAREFFYSGYYNYKRAGLSVRLVRDN